MMTDNYSPPVFPFSAIIGQDAMKLTLVTNAIHTGIRGVLIRGQKGTAKSTAVRALARLLPRIRVVSGCTYGCDPDARDHCLCMECMEKRDSGKELKTKLAEVPFVTLPVNATEDNLVGSIDFEHALKDGNIRFQPGLLSKAHRGILYIDEVNLLDDHLVNLLLDVSASGINIVEREGISFVHPSEFILVGTMNPEEGELRPQFLDRFGLCVYVEAINDLSQRLEIVKRRIDFEEDPVGFIKKWDNEEEKERQHIQNAMELFPRVNMTGERYDQIVQLCRDAYVAGHRADIVIGKTSRAIAAYMGRTEIDDRDVQLAAFLALSHRARKAEDEDPEMVRKKGKFEGEGRQPFWDSGRPKAPQEKDDNFTGGESKQEGEDTSEMLTMNSREGQSDSEEEAGEQSSEISSYSSARQGTIVDSCEILPVVTDDIYRQRNPMVRNASGRRYRARTLRKKGRYIRATLQRRNNDLAFDATLRAAAPYQLYREKGPLFISIMDQDIREKIRERKTSTLLVFVVDASGSMGERLMKETKGAIMYLLIEAYQKRDRVCLIAFRNDKSELLLPPTDSIELARKRLAEIPTGGKTPLHAGISHGYRVILNSKYRDEDIVPLLILITDGRANVGADPFRSYTGVNTYFFYEEIFTLADAIQRESWIKSLVIDVEEKGRGVFGMAERIAERLSAKYIMLDELRSNQISKAVINELGE